MAGEGATTERKAFLKRVNQWASKHGAPPLTDRLLSDLVDERIVPGPMRQPQPGQRTPIWTWGRNSYRRALQVCRFKALGAKPFAELRLLFWIRGDADFSEEVRADLACVFKRMRSQMIRSLGTDDRGPVTGKDAADKRRRKIARRLGQPSPLLRPEGFEFPSDAFADASDLLRYADGNERSIEQLLGNLCENAGLPQIVREQISQLASPAANMFTGLIGNAQETDNSAIVTISKTTAEAFVRARGLRRQEVKELSFMLPSLSSIADARFDYWKAPFNAVASTLRMPNWQIARYVMWLHWTHNATARERAMLEHTSGGSVRTTIGVDNA